MKVQKTKKKPEAVVTAEAARKQLEHSIPAFLDARTKAAEYGNALAAEKSKILTLGFVEGAADRIDAKGGRYFAVPGNDKQEVKIEPRVSVKVNFAEALEMMKTTPERKKYVTVRVSGGDALLRLIKKSGFKEYELTETIELDAIERAVNDGVVERSELTRISSEATTYALVVKDVGASIPTEQEEE